MTEFLSVENVTPAEIHRRLQAVYGENTLNRTTVNRWAINFRECEPGRANIVDHSQQILPSPSNSFLLFQLNCCCYVNDRWSGLPVCSTGRSIRPLLSMLLAA
jgi:hypothetical protein